MGNVSRPLIALLVGTVAFFLLWLVALKPSSSSSGGSSGGVGRYQPAIDQARKAVGVANSASAARGGTVPSNAPQTPTTATTPTSALSPTPSATASSTSRSATAQTNGPSPGASTRMNVVQRALRQHKVLAMLFYNTAGADDRAVNQELKAVPANGGRVVKLAVPLSELAQYSIVTSQVPVNVSPPLVLIDRNQHASTIVGFADRFEIAHRVSDALAGR
jgi:hypothetical protein